MKFKNLRVSVQKVYARMNTDLRGARLDVCIEGDCVSIEGDEIPLRYMIWNRIRTIRQKILRRFQGGQDSVQQS